MLVRCVALAVASFIALPAFPAVAQDVFRYVRPDGSVTFTDSLAALPEKVRGEYNAKLAAREAQRAELERSLGKDELERRDAEAQRARVQQEIADQAERQARLEAIDARLKAYAEADRQRQSQKKHWQDRVRSAKARLQKLYQDFKAAEASYAEISMRVSQTLLPAGDELAQAKATMDLLVPQIDAAIADIELKIPDEARRANIPPGWLRD